MTFASYRNVLLALLTLAPAPALAQEACFSVRGDAAAGTQRLVGLQDVVRPSPRCRYALAAGGPWARAGALAGQDTDFLTLYRQLAGSGAPASGDPRVILAQLPGSEVQHTLMLRYCAHYLLEEQLGFRAVPRPSGGGVRLERVGAPSCDAERVELRAVAGVREARLHDGAAAHTLGASQPWLDLPEGDWSIFAARPGSPVGLRVGVFRSQRAVTPLANHLRTVGLSPELGARPPLLAARWDPGGVGMLLHPTEHAQHAGLLWPELRTASDAGFVWLARVEREGPPVVVGLVQLEAEPAAVRLPDVVVRDVMRERYGPAADALAPDAGDWAAVLDGLAMCLTPTYHAPVRAAVGAAVPEASACAALDGLAVLAQAARGAGERVCLRPGMQVIRSDGVEQELLGEASCQPLPAAGSADRLPYRVAVAGERLRVEGAGLCVLIDDRPVAPDEDGEIVLRSGLLEVRQGGGADCTGRQALSRLRLPVIDPQRDWQPVGLFVGGSEHPDCGGGGEEGTCPWRGLAHDERTHFAYVRPRHELAFSVASSPQVAAAINADPHQPVQITEDVPLLSGVEGIVEGARPPAMVAYVSRDEACPLEASYEELRARPPLDPDALLPDATFHVFLLGVEARDRPARCLARASFRVRPSRAIVAETAGDFLGLEVGLLGDTQAVVYANEPVAAGLMLPLVWFRMSPGIRFITLEVTGALTLGASFDPAELSRVGAALTWALSFGIPEHLPRLISVGGMLHGAAETHSIENPIVSFFVGLNLSTLLDLAGGR